MQAILIPVFQSDKTAFVGKRKNEIYEDKCEGVDVIYTETLEVARIVKESKERIFTQ